MKHKIEEQEALLELLEHPGLPVLMKELEALKEAQARDVLQFDLEDSKLIKSKCRLDGAHKLLSDFKRRLEILKASDKKSKA